MTVTAEQPTAPALTLGWRMRMAMECADLKVEHMSAELGPSRSTVSRWLHDKGEPSRGYVRLWAQITRVPEAWLMYGPGVETIDNRSLHPKVTQPEGWVRGGRGPFGNDQVAAIRERLPFSHIHLAASQ